MMKKLYNVKFIVACVSFVAGLSWVSFHSYILSSDDQQPYFGQSKRSVQHKHTDKNLHDKHDRHDEHDQETPVDEAILQHRRVTQLNMHKTKDFSHSDAIKQIPAASRTTVFPHAGKEWAERNLTTAIKAARLESQQLREVYSRPQIPNTGRSKHDGKWLTLESKIREVYAYSAFYDGRTDPPNLRIIAVAEVKPVNTSLYCHIKYQYSENSNSTLQPVAISPIQYLPIGFGASRHNKEFMTFVLTCALPSRAIPDTVSVLLRPEDRPSFLLPVEVPVKPEKQLDLGACVSVSYWRFDPFRLVEWIEMMQILGVAQVTVYNNTLEAEPSRIFQFYDKLGVVDFRQSHNFISDAGEITFHMHMAPVINDCMYRNMHRFKKILVVDLDELIIPTQHYTIQEMLATVEAYTQYHHMARHYLFRNLYMFLDNPQKTDSTQPSYLSTLRHRYAAPISDRGYAAKSIMDPLSCTHAHNHVCWGLVSLLSIV